MSQYHDFIHDFPSRCHEILKFSDERSINKEREVTLSLMVASAALLVPFERLQEKHFVGDYSRHADTAKQLNDLLSMPFVGSDLCAAGTSSWTMNKVKIEEMQGEVDLWDAIQNPKTMSRDKQTGSVLKIIRNALAHGNIYTRGKNTIERIVFVSEIKYELQGKPVIKDYSCLSVSPADFRLFLLNWFAFLSASNIEQKTAFSALVEAT